MWAALTAARRATATVFALFGFVLGVWVVHIPTIRDRTGVSFHQLGLLLLVLGASSLAAMLVCSRVITSLGPRKLVIAGGSSLCVAVLGPAFSTSALELTAAMVVLGFTSGIHEVGQNAHAVEVEREFGRPIMSSFHAVYSVGGLLAAASGAYLLGTHIDIRVAFAGTAIIGLLLLAASAPFLLKHAEPPIAHGKQPVAGAWSSRVLLIGSVAFALLMAEGVAYDWSSIHLRDSLHADPSTAALGFGAFSMAMVGMRLTADRAVSAFGAATFMRAGTLVGSIGLAVAALSTHVGLAVLGWGLFGLGLAGCVPLAFSAAGAIEPRFSGALVSQVAAIGYLGLLAGPSIIGFLAPVLTLRGALIVPIACCLYAFALAGRAMSQVGGGGGK